MYNIYTRKWNAKEGNYPGLGVGFLKGTVRLPEVGLALAGEGVPLSP